jgi:hypothetical protein
MVGPLRQALGGFTHLLVAVDKFSKWIEARPIVNVCSEEVVSFSNAWNIEHLRPFYP